MNASAAAAPPEAPVRVPAGATPIAGAYIVVLKDGTALPAEQTRENARDVAAEQGERADTVFDASVRGFALRSDDRTARRIAADPRVAYVEQDTVVSLAATQSPVTWGLDRIDQRALPLSGSYTYATDAANVTAYVVDTGILTAHQDFGGRATAGYDAIGDGRNGQDCNGHGTHVAGTVGGAAYGVAKAVRLVSVRVLNCSGSGSNSGVIAGVNWVTANAAKPAVANMSLGGSASSALDTAVRNSITSGVTYALAAGNESTNACSSSPARTAEAITVGATTSTDTRASYSNYGSCLDLFAPGSAITSDWWTDPTATNTISGTSMASPHVAGAAALYLSANPSAAPAAVRDALLAAATPGVVGSPGTGSPNLLLSTGSGGTATPPPTTPTPTPGSWSNDTDLPIPDAGPAVESAISVSGVSGSAPAALKVSVAVRHTFRGDVVLTLVAPTGATVQLKAANSRDGADDVVATYTVDASSQPLAGTWRLRAQDVYRTDTGYLDSWSLSTG
ncbi:S8 family peptidase [Motilibacter deserti]|uniref:S8 family peptidase n=1 Tax=Motilibacter deserti TaxID=2714956 RepID=A0ABX0H3F8_9ACTN|nr:S8 family peptidase [Motilibacter deserti]NHC15918.1 S8 family peptidase [Motilibacter deserti]